MTEHQTGDYGEPEDIQYLGDLEDAESAAPPGGEAPGPAAPAALPETGDPQVDAALAPLAGLPRQPVSEHVARFEAVHRGLQDALAQVDTGNDVETGPAGGD